VGCARNQVKVVVDASAPGCPGPQTKPCQRIYWLNVTRGFDPTSDASLAEITLDQDKTYGKAKLIPPFLNTLSVQKYVVQEFQNASSVTILLRANQTKASIQIGRFGRCVDHGNDPHQCAADVMVGSREKSISVVVASPNGKVTRSYAILVGKGGAGATAPDDDYWQRWWGCALVGKVRPCGWFWLALTGGSVLVLSICGWVAMRRRSANYDRARRFSEREADAQYAHAVPIFRD